MDFVQIGNIAPDNLENAEQRAWIENLDSDHNRDFVEVADGDGSLVRAIDTTIYTLEELLQSDYAAGCYVWVDRTLTEPEEIAQLEAVRGEAIKGHFGGEVYFRPID